MEVSEKKIRAVNCPLEMKWRVDDNPKADEKRNMEVMNFNIHFSSEFQEEKKKTWSNFPKGMSQKSGDESLLIKIYLKGLLKRE